MITLNEDYEINNIKANIAHQERMLDITEDKKSMSYKRRELYIKDLKKRLKDLENQAEPKDRRNPLANFPSVMHNKESFSSYKRIFKEADEDISALGLSEAPKDDSEKPLEDAQAPAPDQQSQEQPLDNAQQSQEPEKSDEEKEAEKEAELELQGRISNVLSDISDMLGPETMRYYKEVEDKAVAYLKTYEGDVDEILDNIQEIGLKILQTSKKNSFIDRDNIVYVACMEGTVDIQKRVKGIPVTNEVNNETQTNNTEEQ